MKKDFSKGFICPHCGSFCKVYHRKLNTSMVLVLLLLYRLGKRDFLHVENWLKEIGRSELRADFHKLRFWNLIEAEIKKREDGSGRNGYYKITDRGIMFAEGSLKVKEKVVLYNNQFQCFEGDEITIKQALKNRFNYDELMGNFAPKTDKQAKELKQLNLL